MISKPSSPPVPKYWLLAEHFREQLAKGNLQPGDRLPSFAEMYAQNKVSRGTVEKAHSILEQEGLIERRNGTGIFVAQPVVRTATGLLGLSGPGFSFREPSLYWSNIMEGICEAADEAEMQLLHLGHKSNRGWEKVDGILFSDWGAIWAVPHLPPGLPRVSVLTPYPDIASVCADDGAGIRCAVEQLIAMGHRRIGYLHSVAHQIVSVNRIQGYFDALKAAGIAPEPDWMFQLNGVYEYGERFVKAAHFYMERWLEQGWYQTGCTALLCHNDETAIGAIAALREAGLEVPRDVSVIGFDGTSAYDLLSPRLTSVEVPLKQIGAEAVRLLLQQISQDAISNESRVLPTALRQGGTCVPLHALS